MQKILLLSLLAALPVLATGPCPTATTGGAYGTGGGGCNVIITYNANGSITTTIPNPNPYDNVEDTLVGVVNNSNSVITSIHLSGVAGQFGFDGDGICSGFYGVSGAVNCPHGTSTSGGNDYLAQALSFSNITSGGSAGDVNFSGIAANGGTAFFSLEEAPNVNLVVGAAVPEPTSVVLFGSALSVCAFYARRRRKNV